MRFLSHLLAHLSGTSLALVRRLQASPYRGRRPAGARLNVEEFENRLVPASSVDLANAMLQITPQLTAIPREHLTGARCHQQFAQVRQSIEQIQWTPTMGDPDLDAFDHATFDKAKAVFLSGLDRTEKQCGAAKGGQGGGPHGGPHHGKGGKDPQAIKRNLCMVLDAIENKYGLPHDLLHAIAWVKSRWRPDHDGQFKGLLGLNSALHDTWHRLAHTVSAWKHSLENADAAGLYLIHLYEQSVAAGVAPQDRWRWVVQRYDHRAPDAAFADRVLQLIQARPWAQWCPDDSSSSSASSSGGTVATDPDAADRTAFRQALLDLEQRLVTIGDIPGSDAASSFGNPNAWFWREPGWQQAVKNATSAQSLAGLMKELEGRIGFYAFDFVWNFRAFSWRHDCDTTTSFAQATSLLNELQSHILPVRF
jgi:hypothetical protein